MTPDEPKFPTVYEYIGDNYAELMLCARHVLARRKRAERLVMVGMGNHETKCQDCAAEQEAAEAEQQNHS